MPVCKFTAEGLYNNNSENADALKAADDENNIVVLNDQLDHL